MQELGLPAGTPVGTCLIDAHAGGVGVLEGVPSHLDGGGLSERLVMVCGTSTCHLAVNERRLHVPGVWGPYWSGERGGGWGRRLGG